MLNLLQDEQELQRAFALHARGDFAASAEICQRIVSRSPNHVTALHLGGVLALELGDPSAAAASLERAARLLPGNREIAINLATVYRKQGDFDNAIRVMRAAVQANPQVPEVWMHLGVALAEGKLLDEARVWMEKATAAEPENAGMLQNLSSLLVDALDFEGALALCEKGLKLQPNWSIFYVVKEKAFVGLGRSQEAVDAARQAVAMEPSASTYKTLVGALWHAGKFEAAIEASASAVQMEPRQPLYHFDRSMLLLTMGRYVEGWKEYEWRRGLPAIQRVEPRFNGPEWGGENLHGKRIVLFTEQGFGDAIQFARYVPMVQARGGRVSLLCNPELKRLLARVEGVEACAAMGEPLLPYEVHCPLLSLGRIFETTLETIPTQIPYISAVPQDAERWRAKLAGPGLKVGLSWSGRPTHTSDHLRSMSADEMARIMGVPGVRYYNLQKFVPTEKKRPLLENGMVDVTDELTDFADTAALVANLDLVITVDTAVGHLAGALGKPTWLLVALVPDWRWGWTGEQSRWYPNMRLFRQTDYRDWASVLARLRQELQKLSGDERGVRGRDFR